MERGGPPPPAPEEPGLAGRLARRPLPPSCPFRARVCLNVRRGFTEAFGWTSGAD